MQNLQIKLSPKLTSLLQAAKTAKSEFEAYHNSKPWDFENAFKALNTYIEARNALDRELNGKLTVEQLGG